MSTASGSGPSRRALLAAVPAVGVGAAVLAASAACSGSTPTAAKPTASPADIAAATGAHARETALLAAYDSAIDRHPGLAATLRVIRAHHADHARALVALGLPGVGAGTVTGSGRPSGAPGMTDGPSPAGTTDAAGASGTADAAGPGAGSALGTPADDTPPARAATLAALAALERTSATGHRTGCLAAGATLAPLLASLCAAESGHAELVATTGEGTGR